MLTKEQETNGLYRPSNKKDGWNRSATDDLIKGILGPLARTWKNKETGRITVGVEKGGRKLVLGSGDSYRSAFENVFVDTQKAVEKMYELDPSWRENLDVVKKGIRSDVST